MEFHRNGRDAIYILEASPTSTSPSFPSREDDFGESDFFESSDNRGRGDKTDEEGLHHDTTKDDDDDEDAHIRIIEVLLSE